MSARPVLGAALALGLLGCNPLAELERFDVDGEQVVNVPGKNLVSTPLSLVPVEGIGDNLSQSMAQTFENQGVDRNDVDSFVPRQVLLEVTAPLDRDGRPLQDLRFLDRVAFVLEAEGQPDAVVADSGANAFGEGVTRLDFAVDTDQDLKAYITAPSMTLRVDATANDRPALGCDLRFYAAFTVDVNPGGLVD